MRGKLLRFLLLHDLYNGFVCEEVSDFHRCLKIQSCPVSLCYDAFHSALVANMHTIKLSSSAFLPQLANVQHLLMQ